LAKSKSRRKKRLKKIIIPIEERVEDIPESTLELTDEGELLKVSKTTLERYSSPKYEIDKILASFSKSLFDLDSIEQAILGIIAKEGSLSEDEIVRIAFKRNANHTRDKIRYRLKHHRNTETLATLGFVAVKTGKKIGNIKNKKEQVYNLTFKGLIGSLCLTKFEDNYMVKKFKDSISKFVNRYNLPEFSIQFMKYHLAMFMLKNVLDGSKLTSLKNLEADMYAMSTGDPFLGTAFPQKIENEKLSEIIIDIRAWFHVYSQVLKKCIEKIGDEGWQKAKYHGNKNDVRFVELPSETNYTSWVLPQYVQNWYDRIERIQFKDLEKFEPHELPYEDEEEMLNRTGLTIDHYAVNIIAKRLLKGQGIHPNFSLVEGTEFIF